MVKFGKKDKYDIDDLVEIIKILRSDDGCPWDRKQTHKSLRPGLIEETYEVIEAIDDDNTELLREELGDLLLQVVFHTQLEEENHSFDLSDVITELCNKLIVRHPHVFSDVKASQTEEVLKNWEAIKLDTKSQTKAQALENITKTLPSLLKCKKILQKSDRLGLTCNKKKDIIQMVSVGYGQLLEAVNEGNEELFDFYFGNLIFALAGLSSFFDVDPELSAKKSCDRYLQTLDGVDD